MKTIRLTKESNGTLLEVLESGNITISFLITEGVYVYNRGEYIYIEDNREVLFKYKFSEVEDDLGALSAYDYVSKLNEQGFLGSSTDVSELAKEETLKKLVEFAITEYDRIEITYNVDQDIEQVMYYLTGSLVATLTLTYNNGNLITIQKS